MKCRHCQADLDLPLVDLATAPPSNAYLTRKDLSAPERYFPLRVVVCRSCWLAQTEDYAGAGELFGPDYAYFSSTSKSWLEHAELYSHNITKRLGLGPGNFVIEVASNDGYLLRNFVAAGIPCLGIEPTDSTAAGAEALGIPVLRQFFGETLGRQLASEGRAADLICGNNVYAHVPNINDFTRGLEAALKPEGVVTLEFPHLLELITSCQFDTIYHEHFSYLSLSAVVRIFAAAGLRIFDVERLTTHGGSLRVYGCRQGSARESQGAVDHVLDMEQRAGLETEFPYKGFQARADEIKNGLLTFLIEAKRAGKSVAAYGAAAKGNTLLNYAGVKRDLLPYVCDAAASKQGKFLPGSRIPILAPAALDQRQPDYILILPWNISGEIADQLAHSRVWGARLMRAMPQIEEIV